MFVQKLNHYVLPAKDKLHRVNNLFASKFPWHKETIEGVAIAGDMFVPFTDVKRGNKEPMRLRSH